MTKFAEIKAACELATQLAFLFGPPWRVSDAKDTYTTLLRGPAIPSQIGRGWDETCGFAVSLQDKSRYCATVLWPHSSIGHIYSDERFDSITVAKSRGIPALVAEIKRRLFRGDAYFQAYAELLQRAETMNAVDERRRCLFAELCGIVEDRPSEQKLRDCRSRCYKHNVRELQVDSTATKVSIDLYLLPETLAREILALLRQRTPE